MSTDTPEIWKPIPGIHPYYEVSNKGRIRSWLRRGWTFNHPRAEVPLVMQSVPNKSGYRRVRFSHPTTKGKNMFVHVCVLLAFVGPRPEGYVCRHLNGDNTNNCLENLAWGTPEENYEDKWKHGNICRGERHPKAKITEDCARQIKQLLREGQLSQTAIGRRFGITQSAVSLIKKGVNWSHVK